MKFNDRRDILPAVLAVSDAIPLVNQAAGTVLVARLDGTTKDAVRGGRRDSGE